MSREQYITTLKRELNRLNQEIDVKILSGQSYSVEAKKHRAITREIRKHSLQSFWNKVIFRFGF